MLQPTASQVPKGLLPKGSSLQGQVAVAQGLRIEGEVHGDVHTVDGDGAMLIVAEGALVIGSLMAPHVVVHGRVQGPIVATQSLQVMAQAQIVGDLQYRHLDLHPDAIVRGLLSPMLGLPEAASPEDGEAAPADSHEPHRDPDASDSELDNVPNHDAGKPESDLNSHEDAVPSRPTPA